MSDPRTSRMKALADINLARDKTRIAVLTEALLGAASANAAALRGRAAVGDADAAAAQAAQSAEGAQPDISQFLGGPVQVNPNDPIGSLQRLGIGVDAGGLAQAGPAGARGGAVANRAVAGARQAAGTAPSPAPSAAPGGPGSVSIGGQQFTAPDELVTTRETTGPFQFGPGLFVPATTRETITTPNVLSAGDILNAVQRQQEFETTMKHRTAEFVLGHALQTNQAKAALAHDLIRSTNAPLDAALQASDAYISGNPEVASKLMAPYDTEGASDIRYKDWMGNYYNALAARAEREAGLTAGSLYDFASFLGIPPGTKPQTTDQIIGTQESINDDLRGMMGGAGWFGLRDMPAAERAARLDNIAKRAASINQVVVLPEVDGKPAPKTIPAPVAVLLLDFADGYPDPAVKEAAARTVERLQIGTVDRRTGRVSSEGLPEWVQPWTNSLHAAWRGHSPELKEVIMERFGPAADVLIDQYGQ